MAIRCGAAVSYTHLDVYKRQMLGGRILYGGALIVGANLLNIHAPFMSMSAFTAGIVTGIPVIFIQIVLVPALILGLKKGGYTFD